MKIGISGAGGQLGRGATDLLLERVAPGDLVLVTHDPSQLGDYAAMGADVREGSIDDADGLRTAYRGVDRLLTFVRERLVARLVPLSLAD